MSIWESIWNDEPTTRDDEWEWEPVVTDDEPDDEPDGDERDALTLDEWLATADGDDERE